MSKPIKLICGPSNLDEKIVKKFGSKKLFGQKKFSGQKNFWVKNIFYEANLENKL